MSDGDQRTYQGPVGAAQDLLVDGLPPCTIAVTADGIWHVAAQLAAVEQAALAAAATHPDTLCQRAQQALGLAGVGSRIEPDHNAIGVYAAPLQSASGAMTLVLESRALLSWVSRASSESTRALIAAAMEAMRQPPATEPR